MDRLDAMKVFVAALDAGGISGAARQIGRSPAAVSRAIAYLEDQLGAELFHRTTRSFRLSDAGERYAALCRPILADIEQAEAAVADEQSAPRGVLTLTATVAAGEDVLRPILDGFMDAYPEVSVRLHLLDRSVNLLEEGMDLALRIAQLADSSLVAVKVGEVRRVLAAAPDYLARSAPIAVPADLTRHHIIAMTHLGVDSWSFPPAEGSNIPRTVQFTPRFAVNSIRSAVAAALAGRGVTRVASYHIADHVAARRLAVVLPHEEYPPLPVHLVAPAGRMRSPKVRAFVDFAVPRLRTEFRRLAEANLQSVGPGSLV